jgi:flagellar biosynthesis/type III secretory pathway chaperone
MDSDALSVDALRARMQAELAAFDALRDLLLAEQNALLAGDVDSVSGLARRKAELVEQLREMGAARTLSLRHQGLPNTSAGVRDWIARHFGAGDADLPALWQRLLDIAHEAQRLNESNGQLMFARMQHNQGALDALQSAAQRSSLYGADGLSSFSRPYRELGRA